METVDPTKITLMGMLEAVGKFSQDCDRAGRTHTLTKHFVDFYAKPLLELKDFGLITLKPHRYVYDIELTEAGKACLALLP